MEGILGGLVAPLAQGFVQRALLAGLALGAAGALLGVFIVQRGLGLLSDGLAHATFGGLALGLLLGATADGATWVALPFTVAIALGIQHDRRVPVDQHGIRRAVHKAAAQGIQGSRCWMLSSMAAFSRGASAGSQQRSTSRGV